RPTAGGRRAALVGQPRGAWRGRRPPATPPRAPGGRAARVDGPAQPGETGRGRPGGAGGNSPPGRGGARPGPPRPGAGWVRGARPRVAVVRVVQGRHAASANGRFGERTVRRTDRSGPGR